MAPSTPLHCTRALENLPTLRYSLKGIWLLLLFCALFCPTLLFAADISVDASLDSRHFTIDQAGILTITIKGSNKGRPEMPHGKGLRISYQSQSSQMQWINGKSSSSLSFVFRVQGTQPGEHTIDPITVEVDGKKYTTKPVKCTVLPAAAGRAAPAGKKGGQPVQPPSSTRLRSGEADQVGFMRIIPAKDAIYVGEQLPITIKALLRQGIRWEGLKSAPRLPDGNFILEYLDEKPVQSQEIVNGVPYTLITWNGILSAIKQGSFPLEVEIDASLLEQAQRQRSQSRFGSSPFNDPFFDNFFGGFNRKNITLISPKKNIEVKGLPDAGKPADFSGAIGSFSLGVSAGPTTVQIGDPITLKMRIQGTGNFDRVHAPAFPETTDWKTYEPSAETQNSGDKNSQDTIDTKIFEQAIIPVNSQLQEIPSLQFSYFDPEQERYITLNSDPIPITLQGNSKLVARQQPPTVPGSKPTETKNDDFQKPALAPIHTQLGSVISTLRPLYQKIWFQLILGLSLIFLTTAVLLLVRKKSLNANPARYEKKTLMKELDRLTTQAQQAMEQKDSKQFFSLCRLILQKRFGFSWQVEPQAICAADLEQKLPQGSPVAALFRQAEHAAYTGEEISAEEMKAILTSIQEDLKQI